MKIEAVKVEELETLAKYIEQLNKQPSHHIGYMGEDLDDIFHSLNELLVDEESSAYIVKNNGKILGFIGVDGDYQRGVGEIWGPFVEKGYEHVGEELLSYLEGADSNLRELHLFCEEENQYVHSLASSFNFLCHSSQAFLEVEKGKIPYRCKVSLLQSGYYNDFVSLHNSLFPNTYYDGDEIINRMKTEGNVYAIIEDDMLIGYTYAEYKQDHYHGSLEFIGVHDQFQGKGIGSSLIKMALSHMFQSTDIQVVKLCVNETNQKALSLYEKCGFETVKKLKFYIKKHTEINF